MERIGWVGKGFGLGHTLGKVGKEATASQGGGGRISVRIEDLTRAARRHCCVHGT